MFCFFVCYVRRNIMKRVTFLSKVFSNSIVCRSKVKNIHILLSQKVSEPGRAAKTIQMLSNVATMKISIMKTGSIFFYYYKMLLPKGLNVFFFYFILFLQNPKEIKIQHTFAFPHTYTHTSKNRSPRNMIPLI